MDIGRGLQCDAHFISKKMQFFFFVVGVTGGCPAVPGGTLEFAARALRERHFGLVELETRGFLRRLQLLRRGKLGCSCAGGAIPRGATFCL